MRNQTQSRRPARPGSVKKQYARRRKVCKFCVERIDNINYKDVKLIGQFVADRGKMIPRRISGVCAPHQRRLRRSDQEGPEHRPAALRCGTLIRARSLRRTAAPWSPQEKTMEVILRADVPKLGHRGDLVDVAAGYARNFLLPRKLAVPATAGNKKVVEQEKAAGARREAKEQGQAAELARQLAEVTVTITRKASEADQLFGSVTSLDIADALQTKGYHIDRRNIHLEEPIKHLGEYEIPLRLHREVSTALKVQVVREQ